MKNTSKISDEIYKLFLMNDYFFVSKKKIVKLKNIVYFWKESSIVYACLEDGQRFVIDEKINKLEKLLKNIFIRTHRDFLVSISRIIGLSRRYPRDNETLPKGMKIDDKNLEECELYIEGIKRRIPVTRTYSKRVKRALNISEFSHLVPDNREDKRFRELGIIRFGWRELRKIDINDDEAVKRFIDKWDIKKFSRERMVKYFRQVGISEIDKRKVIKNIIYQLYEWIKKGIEPLSDGNIRSLWYRIKSVLSYHSNVLEPGDVDIFYDVLTGMIEEESLFKYKDFGFMDMNESYRGIGEVKPEVVLMPSFFVIFLR